MKNIAFQSVSNYLPEIAKLLLLCFSFAPAMSYSIENILAITSGDEKIYQTFHVRLKEQLKDNFALTHINVSEINTVNLQAYQLIITAGHKAATAISEHKSQSSVIYSLIPDNSIPEKNITCIHESCYKVFINQPVNRYINLFNALFPENYTLAFAATQAMTKRSRLLKSAADKNNFNYKEIIIGQNDNIARTLINNLDSKNILLALSDPEIYNANNAKSIILSTYHKNVPIIAYSKSFAKAGALISLYSSIEDIADTTASLAKKIIDKENMNEKEFYPENYSIEINYAVANSLNIDIDSIANIKRMIE